LHLAEQLAKNEHFGFIEIKNGQFHSIDRQIGKKNSFKKIVLIKSMKTHFNR
jgi:hypothetical protein